MSGMKPKKSSIPSFKHAAALMVKVGHEIAEVEMAAFAEAEKNRFQQRIRRQNFPAFHQIPLSKLRLDQKAALGLDLRVMIATSHYVNSIKVRRRRFLNGTVQYHIGFHPSTRARNPDGSLAPITLEEVARVQEYGSHAANVPPRPHWRPHLQEMAGRAMVVHRRIAAQAARRVNQLLKRGL